MPINCGQLQPGLSIYEFMQRDATQAQCEAALTAARWPDGFFRPRCQRPGGKRKSEHGSDDVQRAQIASPTMPSPTAIRTSHLRLAILIPAKVLGLQKKKTVAAGSEVTKPPGRMSKCDPSTGSSMKLRFSVAWNSATANTLPPVLLKSRTMRIRNATA